MFLFFSRTPTLVVTKFPGIKIFSLLIYIILDLYVSNSIMKPLKNKRYIGKMPYRKYAVLTIFMKKQRQKEGGIIQHSLQQKKSST